jgi:hypothetical protein
MNQGEKDANMSLTVMAAIVVLALLLMLVG